VVKLLTCKCASLLGGIRKNLRIVVEEGNK
jgi:hypothetical protein